MDNRQIEGLIFQLKYGNIQERRIASYKLGKSKNSAVVPALITAYNDEDSSVQQNIIDGLSKIGSPEAIEYLNSRNIKRTSVAHINARIRVLFGSMMMIGSLFMPLMKYYAIDGYRVITDGYQSNLIYTTPILVFFVFVGLFKIGTPGKYYLPFAIILPIIAIINGVFVFIKAEELMHQNDLPSSIGLALPLHILGALFLLSGCITIVRRE